MMRILKSRVVRLGAAAIVTGAAVMAVTAQNSFAATCSYQTCSGKDPSVMGCTDAVTKYEITVSHIRSELRYSKKCGSYWNRFSWAPEDGGIGQYATLSGGVFDGNGREILKVGYTKHPDTNPDWTPMVSAAWDWNYFCIYTANGNGCKEIFKPLL